MSAPEERRSYSPWRQRIPTSRTCASALIPDNYCVCNKRKALNASQPMVRTASLALIHAINDFLPQIKCQKLSLKASLSAEVSPFWAGALGLSPCLICLPFTAHTSEQFDGETQRLWESYWDHSRGRTIRCYIQGSALPHGSHTGLVCEGRDQPNKQIRKPIGVYSRATAQTLLFLRFNLRQLFLWRFFAENLFFQTINNLILTQI